MRALLALAVVLVAHPVAGQIIGGVPVDLRLRSALFESVTFANLGTPADGMVRYCSDCQPVVGVCLAAGSGAFAFRQGGLWICEAASVTGTPHNLLSTTHLDTTAATVARGDVVVGQGVVATWQRRALGGVGTYLRSDGTDALFATIPSGDLGSGTADTTTFLRGDRTWQTVAGDGAPTDAGYWIDQANGTLSAERNLGALTTGLVLNTVTASVGVPSAYSGTSCTNQFARSLNASGAATCADVAAADFSSQSGNTVLAAPDGSAGDPTFRLLLDADVPNTITLDTLTQITTRAIADTTGTLAVGRGGTGLTATADDSVLVGDSASAFTARAIPNCGESGTLNYDTATNTFSCLTDGGGGGGANVVEAEVNFGAAGDTTATVTVTGQAWVTSSSVIVCAPTLFATADRDDGDEDALVENLTVAVHTRVAGTGFTVMVHPAEGPAYGRFKVHCTGS